MARIAVWIVTISDDHSINEIALRLRAEGLSIQDVLEDIGCITGSADDRTAERLKKVKGVVDIARDVQLDIGPPGSNKTW